MDLIPKGRINKPNNKIKQIKKSYELNTRNETPPANAVEGSERCGRDGQPRGSRPNLEQRQL
jgi:hypothetical protein